MHAFTKRMAVLLAGMGISGTVLAQKAEVIHWWTSGGESVAVKELASAYKAAGGTWVDTAIAGGGENSRQITINRIAGGKPPTIAQFNTSRQYQEVVAEGLLNDIDAVALKEGWDKFLPEPLKKFVKIDGKYYAMPINIHNPSWFWYSKAVLDKAGVKGEPQNMEQFLDALAKIKASGAIALALGGQAWQEGILFNAILHQGNADLFKKFYTSKDGAIASTPEFKKFLTDFKKLKAFVDPGSPNRDWNVTTALLISNKAGFQVMGDWVKGEFAVAKQSAGKEFGCFPGWGAKAPYMIEGDVFVFPKTKDPEAIKAQRLFATVATSPAVQVAFNTKKGSIPIRTDVDMGKLDICSQQGVNAMKDASRHLSAPSQMIAPEKVGAIQDIITKFWNTNQSVDDAAKALNGALKG